MSVCLRRLYYHKMKFLPATIAIVVGCASGFSPSAFVPTSNIRSSSSSTLNMVLEKPATKKISKLEQLKVKSKNLIVPLKEVRQKIVKPMSNALDELWTHIKMMKSFFPRLIDTCRRKERPCPFSQWTIG